MDVFLTNSFKTGSCLSGFFADKKLSLINAMKSALLSMVELTTSDVEDRKLIIRDAKSGKAAAHVFIPQKIADRLKQYIQEKGYGPDDLIFTEYPFGNRNVILY
jgi:hypothetical protein